MKWVKQQFDTPGKNTYYWEMAKRLNQEGEGHSAGVVDFEVLLDKTSSRSGKPGKPNTKLP